jgi:hypothetical protein
MAGGGAQHAAAVRAERVVLELDALLGRVVALRRVPLVAAEAVERLYPPRAARELLGISNSLWRSPVQMLGLGDLSKGWRDLGLLWEEVIGSERESCLWRGVRIE